MNSTLTFPGAILRAWYCPALGLYRRPGEVTKACTPHTLARDHLLTTFNWLPLYSFAGPVTAGWVLRSYFSQAEDAFSGSHRTMSETTADQPDLLALYAPPGAPGNECAGHVPPRPNRLLHGKLAVVGR